MFRRQEKEETVSGLVFVHRFPKSIGLFPSTQFRPSDKVSERESLPHSVISYLFQCLSHLWHGILEERVLVVHIIFHHGFLQYRHGHIEQLL